MGHTRLSIIDLSEASNQPYQQDDYSLLYNGEVYNFRELVPGAKSDTQAVFKQLQPAGITNVVHQWAGMYALAWVDKRLERVQLLRDAQGIKPLFAFETPSISVYTSELKVLEALGFAEPEWKAEYIQHYLTYKYFPVGATQYKNVYSLKPGFLYQLDKSGVQEKSIPTLSHSIEKKSSLLLDVENHLKSSIQKHSISDVPMGLFLSGGIDSSLLAHMAAAQGLVLPSYSVGFYDVASKHRTLDAEYAEKVADACKFPWRCISLSENDFWDSTDWIDSMEVPVGDSAAWLTYRLSAFAKKEVKAVWSGAGADELFGGYNRHRGFRLYTRYANKKVLFKSGKFISRLLPDGKKARLYKKFFNDVSDDPVQTWNDFCSLKLPLRQRKLVKRKVLDLKAALLDDEKNYLVQDVLAISDSMSMAHSLELRVPFLYQPLIRRMHELSADEVMRKGGKWILKELLKKYNGGYLLKRPKEGFGAPINKWMQSDRGKEWLNTINEKHWLSQHLDMAKWNDMKRKFQSGKLNLGQELISLYVLDKKMK
jgi:asparagine synthase (glutamine-hydrolysing)